MWKVRNDIKHEEHAKHKWTIVEIKDILRNLRKTNTTERYSAEEILTWRKRKIDSWAKRRMKDIEKGTKKQQEDKAALQRFNEKWKIFKPNHQDQGKDSERETEDNEAHETKSGDTDHSGKSIERTEEDNGVNRTSDIKNKQREGDNKTTIEDKQEQRDDGWESTQTKKHESGEQSEHRQSELSEVQRTNGKRKAREQTETGESGRKVKRKTRKKMKQNTLTQYMNMNGGRKRKRDQAAQGDTNRKDTSDSENEQETRRSKRTPPRLPRQTETTKRKGIG